MSPPPPAVIDATDDTFDAEVLAASRERPVVVDFWAPWCGPCRVLGPVIEREVAARGDQVRLVKINTDENPGTAERYRISSIPAVKAFRDGQQVDEFVGARDAGFVRAWLERLAPSPERRALADAVERGDVDALRRLADDAALPRDLREGAAVALVDALLARGGDVAAEVAPLLERLDDELAEPRRRRLAFIADAAAYGGEERASAAVAADPDDLEARWALASALSARGATAEALDAWLEIVARERGFRDDGARKAMLALFDQLGPDSDLARDARRRLMILT